MSAPKKPAAFTRTDAAGLHHAVVAFGDCVRAMRTMNFTPAQVQAEERRLADAKCALRKVQAIRRAEAAPTTAPARRKG